MRVQFHVTEDHIRDGRPTTLSQCPVALAILDHFADVEVEVDQISILIDGRTYPTPKEVAEFVSLFDTAEKGWPFQFTLDIPEEYRP